MNKIIQDQLKRCQVAIIPPFSEDATSIYIKKVVTLVPTSMMPNRLYIVKIKDSVKKSSTIASNWNGGRYPRCNYYKVERLGLLGTMMKLNGIGYDVENQVDLVNESFYGYLPIDGFEVVSEV